MIDKDDGHGIEEGTEEGRKEERRKGNRTTIYWRLFVMYCLVKSGE